MRHHFPYVRMFLRNLRVWNIRAFRTECLWLSKRLFAATYDGVVFLVMYRSCGVASPVPLCLPISAPTVSGLSTLQGVVGGVGR